MKRRTILLATGAGIGGVAIGGVIGRTGPSVSAEIRSLEVSTEPLYPTHGYHFDTTQFLDDPDDVAGKVPIAFDALDGDLQSVVRQIVLDDRPVGFDDPPPGLIDTVEQYVVGCPEWCDEDDVFVELAYATFDADAEPALAVYADVTADRTGIHLTMANTSDRTQRVYSAAGAPFGIVAAVGTSETDHWFPLWSDCYEEDDDIRLEDGRIESESVLDTVDVPSSETITRTYELSTRIATDFIPGDYVLSPHSDARSYLFGEERDVPFAVTYVPRGSQSTGGLSETRDLAQRHLDFRVTFDLVDPGDSG